MVTSLLAIKIIGWPVGRPEIESVRMLMPFIAAIITEAAEVYLAS